MMSHHDQFFVCADTTKACIRGRLHCSHGVLSYLTLIVNQSINVNFVGKSDLHVESRTNEIIKFDGDTTIWVLQNNDVGLDVEFRHVSI